MHRGSGKTTFSDDPGQTARLMHIMQHLFAYVVLFCVVALGHTGHAQCTTTSATTVPSANWSVPTLPATPVWVGNVPPTGGGNLLPAPCGSRGTNCNLCPATWQVTMSAGERAIVYLCAGQRYTITTCSTPVTWDTQLSVTNSSSTILQAWDDDGCGTPDGLSQVTFMPPVSAPYFIKLFGATCTANPELIATVLIQCSAGPCPGNGNDPCDAGAIASCNPNTPDCAATLGAIDLGVAGADCLPVNATTAGYTGTLPMVPPPCGIYPNAGDIWFTATFPASGGMSATVQHLGATNLAMAAYTAPSCAGPFTLLACNSDIATGTVLEPFLTLNQPALAGQSIYIRVWPEANEMNGGTFSICVRGTQPPGNDQPCGAIDLPLAFPCAAQTFSLDGSTLQLNGDLDPDAPTCGTPVTIGDVWFSMSVPALGLLTAELHTLDATNLAMALYTLENGNCDVGAFQQVACSAQAIDSTTTWLDSPTLPVGSTVYLRVWSRNGPFGTFSLCAYPMQPSSNDDPCTALSIEPQFGCLPGFVDMNGSTPTMLPGIPAPSCGTVYSDVWLTTVVPANGEVIFDTDDLGFTEITLSAYRVVNGSCATSDLELEELPDGCASGGGITDPSMPRLELTGVTSGEQILLRIAAEEPGSGGISLCADRTDELPVTPSVLCYYTLRMRDTVGDGWGSSTVTIQVGPVQTSYTLISGAGSISFPIVQGQPVLITYDAIGGFQNQISYTILDRNNALVFGSGSPPVDGLVYVGVGNCNFPPPGPNDCTQAYVRLHPSLGNPTFIAQTSNGAGEELNASNQGCLEDGERHGSWLSFLVLTSGPFAYAIEPESPSNADIDFALWGPLDADVCPPTDQPIRCSFATTDGQTGLDFVATDESEDASGDGWVAQVDVLAGEEYLMYVTNHNPTDASFTLVPLYPTGLATAAPLGVGGVQVAPNPTHGDAVTLHFTLGTSTSITTVVRDAAGRLIQSTSSHLGAGDQRLQLPLVGIEAGSYVVELLDVDRQQIMQARFMVVGN